MHFCNKNIHAFIDTQALHRCSSNTTRDSSKQYTYTGLSDGRTYYIRVLVTDNAGNVGKSAGDNEAGTPISTPSANTNPYNLTTSAPTNLRSTTILTITASATDNEQDTLYYDLYWNGSSTVTETKSGTKGTAVTFTARTGLTKRTIYSWRIVVRDGAGGEQNGASTSAYTNCPGNDQSCVGYKSVTCSYCSGKGSYGAMGTWEGEIESSDITSVCQVVETGTDRVCNRTTTFRRKTSRSTVWISGYVYVCTDHRSILSKTESRLAAYFLPTRCEYCKGQGSHKEACIHGYTISHKFCLHNTSGVEHTVGI